MCGAVFFNFLTRPWVSINLQRHWFRWPFIYNGVASYEKTYVCVQWLGSLRDASPPLLVSLWSMYTAWHKVYHMYMWYSTERPQRVVTCALTVHVVVITKMTGGVAAYMHTVNFIQWYVLTVRLKKSKENFASIQVQREMLPFFVPLLWELA